MSDSTNPIWRALVVGMSLFCLLLGNSQLAVAQVSIPTTELEAIDWLRNWDCSVQFDEHYKVNHVHMLTVPEYFVLGDLAVFENLRSIKIESEDFIDQDMSGIAQLKTLEEIELNCPNATSTSLAVLHYLPKLKKLTLHDCGSIQSIVELNTSKSLTDLRLSGNSGIPASKLDFLGSIPNLQTLSLVSNLSKVGDQLLGDEEAKWLSSIQGLKALYISHATITDEVLATIIKKNELESLGLIGCPNLTGEFIAPLKNCPLTKLDLSKTPIRSEFLADIGKLKGLERLNLSYHSGIETNGKNFLGELHELEELYLRKMSIKSDFLGSLDTRGLKVLDLSEPVYLAPSALSAIAATESLTELNLHGARNVDAEAFAELAKKFPQLSRLDLRETRVKDDDLAILQAFRNLKFLDLSGCRFLGDEGIEHVGKIESLTDLKIESIWRLSDEIFASLSGLRNLENLSIGGSKRITGDELDRLTENQSLLQIRINGVPNLSLDALRDLHEFKSLETIELIYCPLTSEHLNELFGLQVNKLQLIGSPSDESIDREMMHHLLRSLPTTPRR